MIGWPHVKCYETSKNIGLSLAKRNLDLRVVKEMAVSSVSALLQPIPRCSLHL